MPVSELESDFPGRIRALGQREVTEGRRGGPHACTVLEAPVANAFPFVTQSHVRQGKENCYYRVLLHLNHAIFNQDKRKPQLAHKSVRLSALPCSLLEQIHVKQTSESIRSMQTY